MKAYGRLVEVRTETPSSMPNPRKFAAYGIRTVQDLVDADPNHLTDLPAAVIAQDAFSGGAGEARSNATAVQETCAIQAI